MFRGKRISVVIPCHNEEEGIRAVIERMPAIVDEIVVVNNASTDRTEEVAARWAAGWSSRSARATAAPTGPASRTLAATSS